MGVKKTIGRFVFNNGTKAELDRSSMILLKGEIALEQDTGQMKMGNGRDFYIDLPYLNRGPQGLPLRYSDLTETQKKELGLDLSDGRIKDLIKQETLWKKIRSYMKGALIEIDYPSQQMMHIEIIVDGYVDKKHGHYMINFYEYPLGTLFEQSTTVHNLSDYSEIKTIHISKNGNKLYVHVPFIRQYQTIIARAWGSISPNSSDVTNLITQITDAEKPTTFEFGKDFEPIINAPTGYKTMYLQGDATQTDGVMIQIDNPIKTQCTVDILMNGYMNNAHGHFILEVYQDVDGAFYSINAWNLGQMEIPTFLLGKKNGVLYIWFPVLKMHSMAHVNAMTQQVSDVNKLLDGRNRVISMYISTKPASSNFEFMKEINAKRIVPTVKEMENWNALKTFSNAFEIKTAGFDLHSITSPGVYYCSSDVIASSLLNCPTKYSFSLVVEFVAGAGLVCTLKEYHATGNAKTFRCEYYPLKGWSAWTEILTSRLANVAGGYAGLDTNGKISESVLPQSILDRITALENKSV